MSIDTGNQKIQEAKDLLTNSLKDFALNSEACNGDVNCVMNLHEKIISTHSKVLNTVNDVLANTHVEKDFFQNKNLRNDYLGTTKNFIRISLKTIMTINTIAKKYSIPGVSITDDSYITIQIFLNTFDDKESCNEIKKSFEENGISIKNGFTKKLQKNMKNKYLRIQLWVGIPLLIICGSLVFAGEHFLGKPFNGIQLIFLKALLSLTISIVGSSLIEGTATANWTLTQGLTIRAVGWVAVFLLLFFINPASPSAVH